MTKIVNDCSNCEGSLYCISKPSKKDYKFPEEENQYLMDLECGIWNCHTAVIKLLTENKELKAQTEKMKCCENCRHNYFDNEEIRHCDVLNQHQMVVFKKCDKWELAG